MNLYKHTFEHWSQKDSEKGIRNYFVANNDREAYDIVYKSDPMTVDKVCDESTEEHWETGEQVYYIDGVEYPETLTEEETKQIVSDKRGELNFDELDSLNCFNDLYYGLRLDGWELVKEDLSENDFVALRRLGIIEIKDENAKNN